MERSDAKKEMRITMVFNNGVQQWCKTAICILYCDLPPMRQKHHKYDGLVVNQNAARDEEWNKV